MHFFHLNISLAYEKEQFMFHKSDIVWYNTILCLPVEIYIRKTNNHKRNIEKIYCT